jgi:single-strand DNA-binding protein
MNNITVAGQLGRDAELRRLPDGTPVLQFSVADSQGREKPTIWWNCQLFGKRAESLQQYLAKGQRVTVSGSVSEREWKDKEGQTRKSMDVRVNEIALQSRPQGEQAAKPALKQEPKKIGGGSGFDDMDDDIPF